MRTCSCVIHILIGEKKNCRFKMNEIVKPTQQIIHKTFHNVVVVYYAI